MTIDRIYFSFYLETRGEVLGGFGLEGDTVRIFIDIDNNPTTGYSISGMGADYLVYALIDAIVDHYFVVLEQMGEEVESLEENLIANPVGENGSYTAHNLFTSPDESLLYFMDGDGNLQSIRLK